jgi:hypothetical protein
MRSLGESSSAMDQEAAASVGNTRSLRRTPYTKIVGSFIRRRAKSEYAAIVTGAQHGGKHLAKRGFI